MIHKHEGSNKLDMVNETIVSVYISKADTLLTTVIEKKGRSPQRTKPERKKNSTTYTTEMKGH